MMKMIREWIPYFKIPEAKVTEWLSASGSAVDFTYWCLKNKKIKDNEYLQWAKNHYQLPVLKSEYFHQPVDNSWWDIVRSVSNWSEHMFPIAEWDNTIFIVCIEPRKDIHWSFPVQFLLASSADIEKRWFELNNSQIKKQNKAEPEPSQLAAPTNPSLMISHVYAVTADPTNVTFQSATEPDPEVWTSPPTSEPEPEIVLTESSSEISSPSLSDNISNLKLEPVLTTPQMKTQIAVSADTPDGLNIKIDPSCANMASDDMPEGLNLNSPAKASAEVPEGLNIEMPEGLAVSIDTVAPEGLDAPSGLYAPENNSEPVANPQSAPQLSFNTSTVNPSSNVPVAQSSEPLNNEGLKSHVGFNPELQRIFNELHGDYNQVMVLMFEGEKLKHWSNDGNWKPRDKGALLPIDISEPCIFRIVKNSAQPFHGPISSNHINDSFFQSWSLTTNPPHVTIAPIKYDSYVAGMLLAVANKDLSSFVEILERVESLTEKMKPILENYKSAA